MHAKQKASTILITSSVHLWNDPRIYHKEAKSLTAVGEIMLIGVENKAAAEAPVTGIRLITLPGLGLRGQPGWRLWWRLRRILKIAGIVLQGRYKVFHFHDPELLPVGWLARLRGRKAIYDMHESLPGSLASRRRYGRVMAKAVGWVMRFLELATIPIMHRVILVAESFRAANPWSKCAVIQNYPIMNGRVEIQRRAPEESLRLIYAGSMTYARGISDIIEALRLVRSKGQDVTLDLYGNIGDEGLLAQIEEARNDGITYSGILPLSELFRRLPSYHVGLNTFRDLPNQGRTLNTKVYDYLVAGLPIISSDLPALREYVKNLQVGLLFTPGDSHSLAGTITQMLDEDMRYVLAQNTIRHAYKYTWGSQAEKLVEMYQELLA